MADERSLGLKEVELASLLAEVRGGAFFGTPCGVLAPLYSELERKYGLMTLSREDTAVGVAVGAVFAGQRPVVLMQNSGFGQALNAYASLVVPSALDLLTVVGMRGTGADGTEENLVMGRLTRHVIDALPAAAFEYSASTQYCEIEEWVKQQVRGPAFLLVDPSSFGWAP